MLILFLCQCERGESNNTDKRNEESGICSFVKAGDIILIWATSKIILVLKYSINLLDGKENQRTIKSKEQIQYNVFFFSFIEQLRRKKKTGSKKWSNIRRESRMLPSVKVTQFVDCAQNPSDQSMHQMRKCVWREKYHQISHKICRSTDFYAPES